MSLFIRKPLNLLQKEAREQGTGSLKRVLGPASLIALGVGTIVGAGLFSITGLVAANNAGPAIVISFVIASVCCCFAGLCYAEFAAMIPIAGSAYTYSYATMGELTACPWEGGLMNLPALLIVIAISLLLVRGTKESAVFNFIVVFLKTGVIVTFIILGWKYINTDNYTPFLPENTGTMGEFGISGVLRGAAIIFFAYLGFDVVSTTAQETKNPRRNMPIGILGSLAVCLLLYLLFAHVMTGVTNYTSFQGKEGIAPVAVAISKMGIPDANGVIRPVYPWLNKAIILAILIGYCSVIMGTLMAQSRIFMSMSRDGMLPPFFSRLHKRYRTPAHNSLLLMLVVGLLAAFVPAGVAGEMCSIGTLFAFILVCAGIIIMRRSLPDAPRAFKVPWVPVVPILGIVSCFIVALSLPADTWIRLVLWMLIGLDIYHAYGMKRSRLEPSPHRKGASSLVWLGLFVSVLCIITGCWHQGSAGWNSDYTLLSIALVMGFSHIVYYILQLSKIKHSCKNDK